MAARLVDLYMGQQCGWAANAQIFVESACCADRCMSPTAVVHVQFTALRARCKAQSAVWALCVHERVRGGAVALRLEVLPSTAVLEAAGMLAPPPPMQEAFNCPTPKGYHGCSMCCLQPATCRTLRHSLCTRGLLYPGRACHWQWQVV